MDRTNTRKHTGPISGHRPDQRTYRVESAQESQIAWRKKSVKEQLAELDNRLGVGVGAKKQRARLASLLSSKAAATTDSDLIQIAEPKKVAKQKVSKS